MPADDRLSRLVDSFFGDLSQEKLESLSREFEALAQDRAETLVFFVPQNVCQRLTSALEGEAVSVERFEELTTGIADQIADILRDLQKGTTALPKLEPLVTTLFRNSGLFRHEPFGVFYQNDRPTKNALEKKWVDSTREKLGQPSDLALLQKTFDRMK